MRLTDARGGTSRGCSGKYCQYCRRQFAIKRPPGYGRRIVNINFGWERVSPGGRVARSKIRPRERLTAAFRESRPPASQSEMLSGGGKKKGQRDSRLLFFPRLSRSLLPPLDLSPFFHPSGDERVDISGHQQLENRRNPSYESTGAHQDSAFKLVKSTTSGEGTR